MSRVGKLPFVTVEHSANAVRRLSVPSGHASVRDRLTLAANLMSNQSRE